MNILIIGGAGYIGSHVVREFLDLGHKVTVFDNLSSGLRENLFPEAAFIHGSIMDYPGLLNAASECGLKYIVFSSSAAVYGEPQYLPIDEKHPTDPENYYGFTKLEIERFLGWYDRIRGIRYASLRYFNAAGYDVKGRIAGLEQNPANLIPVIMEAACGMRGEVRIFGNDYDTPDGTGVRDYVHVSDLAAGHAAALDYIGKADKSVTVNLGSESGLSVLEIIDISCSSSF
jgi:UDP-glucose 4-epimerase